MRSVTKIKKQGKKRKYTTKLLVWGFKNVAIDEIIDSYISLTCNPKTEIVNWDKVATCTGVPDEIIERVVKKALPKPRRQILYEKYLYLNHLLIFKAFNHNNQIRLNTKILRKIFGDFIYPMLKNLEKMGIISISNEYTIGEESRLIVLEYFDITRIEIYSPRIIEYKRRLELELQEWSCNSENAEQQKEMPYNKDFITKYNAALSLLELRDKDEAIRCIMNREYKTEQQRKFNLARIVNYENNNKTISSIDKNNRIYHYITNIPKYLKRYFNIRYQIDISNSHPLLYTDYLIKYYNINKEILKIISEINLNNINDYNNRNVTKLLYKTLKDNDLHVTKREIPKDVLLYIFQTMKGIFWNNFMLLFDDNDRGHIKSCLFREVFYSYATRIRSNKIYGKQFVKLYPNVWKVLRHVKMTGNELLPNVMMKLESSLFYAILSKCFERNWKVINIHDAILVLDTSDNRDCSVESVKEIIKEVYNQNNLFPTVSVDNYMNV